MSLKKLTRITLRSRQLQVGKGESSMNKLQRQGLGSRVSGEMYMRGSVDAIKKVDV